MGHALSDNVYLTRTVRDPASGRKTFQVGIRCRSCATEDWATAPQPGWGRRIFKKRGWKCGNGPNQHTCTVCLEKRRERNEVAQTAEILPFPDQLPLLVTTTPTTTTTTTQEEAPMNAFAEALAPVKQEIERRHNVKGSRGKPSGYSTRGNCNAAARAAMAKMGVPDAKDGVHFNSHEDADGTFSYTLIGVGAGWKPPPLRVLRQKEGDRIGTRAGAVKNAKLACERAGIKTPLENVHFEVSGSLREGGWTYKLLPAAHLGEQMIDNGFLPRTSGGGYLSRWDARKAALAVLQSLRKTGGAPVENADYWITQDGFNLWGWTTTNPNPATATVAEISRDNGEPPPEPEAAQAEEATPTPAERRKILKMLNERYDEDAKRYRGEHSDLYLSDLLGVPETWVAQIREEFDYGPNVNEAVERGQTRAQLDDMIGRASAFVARGEEILEAVADATNLLAELKSARAKL